MADVELGLGLVGIGRALTAGTVVPETAQVNELLRAAVDQGVRVYDTAASYGKSEERLGAFLRRLSADQRAPLFVATKCGEEFDVATGVARVDHTPDGLRRSIDRSLAHLPHVSLLQLHKAGAAVLRDEAVLRVLEEYRGRGVALLGASVSDLEAGRLALANPLFDAIQMPYNETWRDLEPLLAEATRAGKQVLTNRPLATGRLLAGLASRDERRCAAQRAFELVLAARFRGAVLVGTTRATNLEDNLAAFRAARSTVP